MADELKKDEVVKEDVKEVEITPAEEAQLAEQIEVELNEKVVQNVENIIHPPDEDEEVEEVKIEKKADEVVKEDVVPVTKVEVEVKDDSTPVKKDDSVATKTSAEQVTELNLPNRLIQAAKRNHITDEEVLTWGKNAESILGKLADNSDRVSEQLGELGRKAKTTIVPKKEVETTLELAEDVNDVEEVKTLKNAYKVLNSKLAKLESQLTEKDKKSTLAQGVERDKKIDTFFDKVDYSEFGKSEKLTNVELIMRKNVWEKADDIMIGASVNGIEISLDEALEQAMSIYEGKNPRKVKEKIVAEVTKREQGLTHRPKSKKTLQAPPAGEAQAVAAVKKFFDERANAGW